MPFEYDLCVFSKLRKVSLDFSLSADRLLLECSRRVNLDDFWPRHTSVVESNFNRVSDSIRLAEIVCLIIPFKSEGPFLASDNFGYEVTIIIVMSSRMSVRHVSDCKKWDAMRKIRSTFSKHARNTPKSVGNIFQLSREEGKHHEISKDKYDSL